MSAAVGGVTRESLVEKALALGPVLIARAQAADAARKLPVETVEDFQEAGFFRMLQPARVGGLEMDPQAFFDVQIAIARACPSSAWVLGVVAVHNWQLALFEPQAQEDVWGEDPSTLISSSYMPVGEVTRVEGGFKLSGRWGFSSGSDHCQWAFLGAFVPPEPGSKKPDMRTFLVPRSDYRLEDTWHVSGLKATGSNDVVVEGAFVPEHHTHKFGDGFMCKSPGQALNTGPLYRIPFGQIFVRSVSTPALGMAQGALDTYQEVMRARVSRADGGKGIEDPAGQRIAAVAESTIDHEKLVLHRNFDAMMAAARAEAPLSIEDRVKWRYESSMAVVKCVEVVRELFSASGSRSIFLDSPMQRYFQDVHACRAHYANNPEKPSQNYGRVQLGLRNQDFFI